MPNVELLTKTLDHIENHRHLWDQAFWRHENGGCGTTHCFAGWAVILAGGSFATRQVGSTDKVVPPGADPDDNKKWRNPDDLAAELLGIPNHGWCECGTCGDEDMAPLFAPDNTLVDIRRIVAEHIAGEDA